MGAITYGVRPLARFDPTGDDAYSDYYELEDAVEVHFQGALTEYNGSPTNFKTEAFTSIDGVHWGSTAIGTVTATAVGMTRASITSGLMRFLRFKYSFTGGSSPTAVFSLDCFIKTRT